MHHALSTELAREHTTRRITEATRVRAAAHPATPAVSRSRRRIGRLTRVIAPAQIALDTSSH